MKQSLLYSSIFFLLINTCSLLFSMERPLSLERPRSLSAAEAEATSIIETLKNAAKQATNKNDIKSSFVAALGQDQQYWHTIFSYALKENPPKVIETKLRRLAKLLLARPNPASDGSRLEGITDIKLLIEFHKMYAPLSSSSKTIRGMLGILEIQVEKKVFEQVDIIMALSKDKWLSIFSRSYDNYPDTVKKKLLKLLADKFLPKIQDLDDTDSLLIGVYLEKFTTAFGPVTPLNREASVYKVIEKLKEKEQQFKKRHSSSVSNALTNKLGGSLGRNSGKAMQDSADQPASPLTSATTSPQTQGPAITPAAPQPTNVKPAPRVLPAPPASPLKPASSQTSPVQKSAQQQNAKPAPASPASPSVKQSANNPAPIPAASAVKPHSNSPASPAKPAAASTGQTTSKPAAISAALANQGLMNKKEVKDAYKNAKEVYKNGDLARARALFTALSKQTAHPKSQQQALQELADIDEAERIARERQKAEDEHDLYMAKEYGATPLHTAAYRGRLQEVIQLIAAGANVDAKDSEGYTALHDAAGNGKTDVVKLLIQANAKVNAKDNTGWTALHMRRFWGMLK